MGLTKLLSQNEIYDGKRLWETYMGWGRGGSHKKLREWAANEGMTNPSNGKVSHMGPYWAMWRYALRNPEEAFPAYKACMEEYLSELLARGVTEITFELFLEDVREKAMKNNSVVSRKAYREFCEKYGLKENGKK